MCRGNQSSSLNLAAPVEWTLVLKDADQETQHVGVATSNYKGDLCSAGSESTAVLATAALDKKVRLWRSPKV